MKKYTFPFLLMLIMLATLTLKAQIGMRIPDSTVISGNNIDIPVYAVNTLTGNNVLSYMLQLSFNQSYLQVVSVLTAGTISAAFGSPAVNTSVSGQVTIAGAGTSALTGAGKFIYIRFKALQPGNIAVNFTGVQNNFFNEGTPSMTFDNGIITINPQPAITVSPNTGTITKGETLQFTVSGGVAPYTWFVTSPSVASISPSGLMTGNAVGFTKVVAVDNNGLRDTTNSLVEVRGMRLSIPTNLSQWQDDDINVPVNTTNLTGLNIMSGSLSLSFNQNILTPTGIVQTGTLLASYSTPVFNFSTPGVATLDFAGVNPLTGSGTLIYITFHVSPTNTGSTGINFQSGLFNEDLLPNFTNGLFSTINLPVLSLSPLSGTMVAGQTKQFTLNGGGTPPIVWTVSNPVVASVSQTGLMTTYTGGTVTVTATDFHGATATTGNWLVYDTQVIMPDTSVCPAATEFYYPILVKALPAGESIQSVQATVSFNSTYLTFQSLVNTYTLTQGWTFATNPSTSQVILAGSGTTLFNTAGVLAYLKFTLNPAFTLGANAALTLSSIILNEGVPNPLVDQSGFIARANISLPVSVSVIASLNPVYSGTPVTFTATPVNGGAIPLFQWKVNSVNVPGATNPTYTYVPLNNDNVNCIMTSGGTCVTGNPATSNTVVMTVVNVPVNTTISGNVPSPQVKCYSATNTITVAGGVLTFTVQNGGSATMIAGHNIDYLPGTRVFPGGYMHGYISAGPYCPAPPLAPVTMGQEEILPEPAGALFKIFPNPTTGSFTLVLTGEKATTGMTVEIFGMQGDKVLSGNFSEGMKQNFSLDDRPAGLYFVRVICGDRVESRKIIKQ